MRPPIKREPHLEGETAVEYEERMLCGVGSGSNLGDLLLKRHVNDFVVSMQGESPLTKLFQKRDVASKMKFKINSKGAYFK